MLKDRSAAELAAAFDDVHHFPHNTGGLSMLDEATGSFARLSADVAEAHRRFSAARYAHKDSYQPEVGEVSEDAWQAVLAAGDQVATALRQLGDRRIARCQEPTHHGICKTVLDDDGRCYRATDHAVTP